MLPETPTEHRIAAHSMNDMGSTARLWFDSEKVG